MADIPSPSARVAGMNTTAVGFAATLGAFLIWGLVSPVYMKNLDGVGATEIVAHRIVWTFVMVGLWLVPTKGLAGIVRAVGSWRRLGIFTLSAALVSANWLAFTWAVTHGHLVECSLGYYINPLVNVLLGVVVLHERLSRLQGLAVAVASAGVLSLVVTFGSVPWVAFLLAFSFGFYALVRKKAAIDPMVGLVVETGVLSPVAVGYLLWLAYLGVGNFGVREFPIEVLILCAGPMTAVPLALFMVGASRLRLSTLGLIQYVGPTCQLLMGVLVYGEPFSNAKLFAFALIWVALAIYSADAFVGHRASRAAARAA